MATPKPSRKHGLLKRLAAYVLVAAALVVGLNVTGCVESSVFYHPTAGTPPPPVGVEEVWISGPKGSRLHGWFLPAIGLAPGQRAPAVLFVHGNAGNVGDHLAFCDFLPRVGVHVLLFDYRGYGNSDGGRLLRANLIADTHAALDHLLARDDVDPDRIGLLGGSLGGVIGLAVAAERAEIGAAGVVSGFSSWKRVAGDFAPVLGQVLIPGGYNAEDSAAKLGQRSLLLVHSSQDEIVRFYHSQRIRDAAARAGVPVELVELDGFGHNDWIASSEAVEAVQEFFRRELVERD